MPESSLMIFLCQACCQNPLQWWFCQCPQATSSMLSSPYCWKECPEFDSKRDSGWSKLLLFIDNRNWKIICFLFLCNNLWSTWKLLSFRPLFLMLDSSGSCGLSLEGRLCSLLILFCFSCELSSPSWNMIPKHRRRFFSTEQKDGFLFFRLYFWLQVQLNAFFFQEQNGRFPVQLVACCNPQVPFYRADVLRQSFSTPYTPLGNTCFGWMTFSVSRSIFPHWPGHLEL